MIDQRSIQTILSFYEMTLKTMNQQPIPVDELCELLDAANKQKTKKLGGVYRELTNIEARLVHLDLSCLRLTTTQFIDHIMTFNAPEIGKSNPMEFIYPTFFKELSKFFGNMSTILMALIAAEANNKGILSSDRGESIVFAIRDNSLCAVTCKMSESNLENGSKLFELDSWNPDSAMVN